MDEPVNVHEAKARLSELLKRVRAGEVIVLAKHGKPCAKLMPLEPEKVRLGFLAFKTPDSFFEPLPEEDLKAWNAPDQ